MNEYQADNCKFAAKALMQAYRLLREADHDLFTTEGMSYQHVNYRVLTQQLMDLHQEYYAKFKEISELLDKEN